MILKKKKKDYTAPVFNVTHIDLEGNLAASSITSYAPFTKAELSNPLIENFTDMDEEEIFWDIKEKN